MPQLSIDATNPVELTMLADAIRWAPAADHPKILAEVYALDLMRPGDFWLAPFFWFMRKARGRAGMHRFFALLHKRNPEITRQWIEDTARHVTDGRDTEDDDSIGGWSQREIDSLQSRLAFSALEVEICKL